MADHLSRPGGQGLQTSRAGLGVGGGREAELAHGVAGLERQSSSLLLQLGASVGGGCLAVSAVSQAWDEGREQLQVEGVSAVILVLVRKPHPPGEPWRLLTLMTWSLGLVGAFVLDEESGMQVLVKALVVSELKMRNERGCGGGG